MKIDSEKKFFSLRTILLLGLAVVMMGGGSCLFTSCNNGKQEVKKLGKAVSGPYELLLVANKDWLNTNAGQTLMVVLNSPIEGLPQPEPHFRITTINPHDFKGTFAGYANVIMVDIGKDKAEKHLSLLSDLYCKDQLLMLLGAPDNDAFIELVRERAELILSTFDEREIARESRTLAQSHSTKVLNQANKQFGITMYAPKEINELKSGKDFLWASAMNDEARMNVCVYTVPLRSVTTIEEFVALRDSVMKINIPGKREGVWMETDIRSVTTHNKNIGEEQRPVVEFKGLWDMKDDAMGGPFVSYVQADYTNSKLLITEGFVFAPSKDKRAMIRQLEGALQSVVLP